MMKLSTLRKVRDTVDLEWHSPIAQTILKRWGAHDNLAQFFRASANFVFVFEKGQQKYFLRFTESHERSVSHIEAEIKLLLALKGHQLKVVQPIPSLENRYIETVTTAFGTFHAVVFKALPGRQYELEDLTYEQMELWGAAVGRLHNVLRTIPDSLVKVRGSWKDKLEMAAGIISRTEPYALLEVEEIRQWADSLPTSPLDFGYVHYDCELDNQRWDANNIQFLDFDDSCKHWFVADIAYALRDVFGETIDLTNPLVQRFLVGYRSEKTIHTELLNDIAWFLRMHNVIMFAKLLSVVDVEENEADPQWFQRLRRSLNQKIETYRNGIKQLHA